MTMAAGLRATAKAGEHPPEPKVGAPVLDPTVIVAKGSSEDIRSLARRGRHDRIVIRAQVEQIARTVAQVPEECW